MKIALPVREKDLNSVIDPRFGRATGYLIVDSETKDCQFIPNPAAGAARGAGIAAAQVIVSQKAEAVVVGSIGPTAFSALETAGVTIYQGLPNQTAKELVDSLTAGKLTKLTRPSGPPQRGAGPPGRRGGGGGPQWRR